MSVVLTKLFAVALANLLNVMTDILEITHPKSQIMPQTLHEVEMVFVLLPLNFQDLVFGWHVLSPL